MALTDEQTRQIRVFTDRGFDHTEAIYIVEAIRACSRSEGFQKKFGAFGVGALRRVLQGELKGSSLPSPPKRIDLGSLG